MQDISQNSSILIVDGIATFADGSTIAENILRAAVNGSRIINDLVTWEQWMGGWDATIWEQAKSFSTENQPVNELETKLPKNWSILFQCEESLELRIEYISAADDASDEWAAMREAATRLPEWGSWTVLGAIQGFHQMGQTFIAPAQNSKGGQTPCAVEDLPTPSEEMKDEASGSDSVTPGLQGDQA